MASATWRLLCSQATRELAAGRRNDARRLAHQAAQLAPQQEEPWLVLAAIATPRASLAYLRQALELNPRSSRAKKGLKWAEQRIVEERSNKRIPGRSSVEVMELPRFGNAFLLGLLALTAAFAVFAVLRPPEVDEGLRVAGVAVAHEIDALLATETPTLTATYTISPTPSLTSTPTQTPTLTPTETPSPTPTATTETNPEEIAKFKVEPPNDVENNDRWIDINLTDQTLAVYDGSDLVDSFRVSTGTARTPTVTGEFSIWAKVRMQDMSGPGYYVRDVPWVMYFYKSYGIHGTWWHNNFGTPMSAGCVNMTIEDAEWMYSWASVGTIVSVHY
jgi:lipoprotein-anchoring transpeptidase ErfK/SrfK